MDAEPRGHHDGAGPDQLLDAVGPDERDERVDLGLGAGHLDDDRPVGQVDDPAARQLDELEDLGPVRVGRPDLHQRQLLLDGRLGGDVLDLEHVDQPVELLGRLLDRDVVAVEGDRHPADVRLVGVADRERVDVEVARPHQARHPVQDARLVEDDRDQDVAAGLAAARQGPRRGRRACGGPRAPPSAPGRSLPVRARIGAHSSAPPHFSIRSDRPLPAGIIGKTFCSSAISNQTSAGPSTAWAARIASSTSSGVRARNAGIPKRRRASAKSGPGQVRRVVVAGVDDLLPLPDHPELLVVEEGDLDRDPVLRRGSSAPGRSSGSRRRR